jgi:hypothetical protein
MSHSLVKRKCFVIWVLCSTFACFSQPQASEVDELAKLHTQREALAQDKKIVLDQFQNASKECWRKFAVNDCLANARREKYQQLAPLDLHEIQLNARQRELKEIERQQRLSDKASSKGNS